MLSDLLAESADKMRRYLREFPDVYSEVGTEAEGIIKQWMLCGANSMRLNT